MSDWSATGADSGKARLVILQQRGNGCENFPVELVFPVGIDGKGKKLAVFGGLGL